MASSGKTLIWLKNSMLRTILKSFKARWRSRDFQSTSEYHIQALVGPAIDLANEFTTFMVPHSLVILRPRHLALSFEMKLCVAPVFSNT